MPKGQVTDLITDQEMHFARLVLSGTMTDREAANAAGLDPNTAAYIKSKPRVRAYMLEHRAAAQAQLAQQEAEELRRKSLSRERVLARLWEIAEMSPALTRSSVTGQMKAMDLIVAIEGLTPDRVKKQSAPPPLEPNICSGQQEDEAAVEPAPTAPPPAPGPTFSANDLNPYDFAYLCERLCPPPFDPTAAFSIKKEKPYVPRF